MREGLFFFYISFEVSELNRNDLSVLRQILCRLTGISSGKEFTNQFPEFWHPSVKAQNVIFDGEVTVITEGKPDLEVTMSRYLARNQKVAGLSRSRPAVYIVWDLLWMNDQDIARLPLLNRKAILDQTLENNGSVRKIDFVQKDGLKLWAANNDLELEGLTCKRIDSTYDLTGSSNKSKSAWLKVKRWTSATVNVLGYSVKDGAVLVGLGSIVQGRALGISKREKEIRFSLARQLGKFKEDKIWLPEGVKGKVKFASLTPKGT